MKRNLRKANSSFLQREGMTLVEILVSMSILTIVGFGLLSGFVATRKETEGSIYLNTATTIAQGYMEQIKSLNFEDLSLNPLPTVINQGLADPLTVSPNVADVALGNSATDVENVKLIDLNNTPADTADDLRIAVVAYVEDLTNTASGVGEARRISLRYSYRISSTSGTLAHTNLITSIRSEVPTF